jgi:GAF domain-containing protein
MGAIRLRSAIGERVEAANPRAEIEMPFALQLRRLLELREHLMPAEFAKGEPLESVLERYLLVVESTAEPDTITSILLLDGTTLHHGAGPNLPRTYREQIDGSQIGPKAGSCGTAAFLGRPVYVSDIVNDPLWEDYRDLALSHKLRACWSTPIRSSEGRLLGTFAVYHQRPRDPTKKELEAIRTITEHVARAIMWYRGSESGGDRVASTEPQPQRPALKLVHEAGAPAADGEVWKQDL